MRFADRSVVTLSPEHYAAAAAELEAVMLSGPRGFVFKVYKSAEIKKALTGLFHGKCAYCETFYSASAPVDVEHYRPKASVAEDSAHKGYWWVAMEWKNLLPSCIDCNRKRKQRIVARPPETMKERWLADKDKWFTQNLSTGKQDSFPISSIGQRQHDCTGNLQIEGALLLNPCEDNPEAFLSFAPDGRGVGPFVHALDGQSADSRGNASIQIYGLNRLGLFQDRLRILRQLEFMGEIVLEVTDVADKIEALSAHKRVGLERVPSRLRMLRERLLIEMKEMASQGALYSAMAKQWLSEFVASLA